MSHMRTSLFSFASALALTLLLSFSCNESAAQRGNQYPATTSQQMAQDHYYQHVTIVYHGVEGKLTTKAFKELSTAERSNLPSHLPPSQRSQVAAMDPLPAGTEVHVSIRGRVMIVPPSE